MSRTPNRDRESPKRRSNVLSFPKNPEEAKKIISERKKGNKEATPQDITDNSSLIRLKTLSDQIDDAVLTAIHEGVDPYEVASIVSHRLGTVLRQINEKDKEQLWEICQKVAKKQAVIE